MATLSEQLGLEEVSYPSPVNTKAFPTWLTRRRTQFSFRPVELSSPKSRALVVILCLLVALPLALLIGATLAASQDTAGAAPLWWLPLAAGFLLSVFVPSWTYVRWISLDPRFDAPKRARLGLQALAVLLPALSVFGLSAAYEFIPPLPAVVPWLLLLAAFLPLSLGPPRQMLTVYLTYSGTHSKAPSVWLPAIPIPIRFFTFVLGLLFTAAQTTSSTALGDINFLPGACALVVGSIEAAIIAWLGIRLIRPRALAPSALAAVQKLNALGASATAADCERTDSLVMLALDDRTPWLGYVERLRASTRAIRLNRKTTAVEAEHLFLGYNVPHNFPVLLHRQVLNEHCYISGRPGSGKTSRGIFPLVRQLMEVDDEDRPAVLIIDLGADDAFFHGVRLIAKLQSQPFLFFTPMLGVATHPFNPFQSIDTTHTTLTEICQLVLDALDLNHGPGYGRGYFSKQSRFLLSLALKHPSKPQSFEELQRAIETQDQKARREAFELVETIRGLTEYPQLLAPWKPTTTAPIHMPTVLEKRQCVYFYLPSSREAMASREIGKLALFAMKSAAESRSDQKLPPRKVVIVIDEFQRLAGENLAGVLQLSRKRGMHLILANQSRSELQTPGFDLRAVVRSDTATKLYFSVEDYDEAVELTRWAGSVSVDKVTYATKTGTTVKDSESVPINEKVTTTTKVDVPRLTIDHVRNASADPFDVIMRTKDSGLSQYQGVPVIFRSLHAVPEELHRAFGSLPWPLEPRLHLPTRPSSPPPPPSPKHARRPNAEGAATPSPGGQTAPSGGSSNAAERRRKLAALLDARRTFEGRGVTA